MTSSLGRWLIFDADDTLFDYRAAEDCALAATFASAGVAFQPDWAPVYRTVNARAWRELEAGRINQARLRTSRFEELFAELGLALDAAEFGSAYLGHLSRQTQLVDDALEVVEALRSGHGIAVVTNGLAEVQRPRFATSPLGRHVDHLVISEEVGIAKPDPAIFALALERMGDPDPHEVLVVGDSLASDIAGGNAAGLATCWFNPRGLERTSEVTPTHEIRRLAELPALVERRGASGWSP
jgi:2-haloacid dehalogenase